MTKVQFVHGLESSPLGAKARYLAARFEARTPEMDTSDFEASVRTQAAALEDFHPDVLIGSSFGGAVVAALVQRGLWSGPTLLLAPAVAHYGIEPNLVGASRVIIVHGTLDDVVDIAGSRELARRNDGVELREVNDGHRLATLLEGERLAELVHDLATNGSAVPSDGGDQRSEGD